MSFVRPAARNALWQWRETLAGLALLVTALVWAGGSFGVYRILALVLTAIAVIIVVAGIQRARFRGAQDGQGVVSVDERQITYFGPLTGGTIALADIGALSLNKQSAPPHWQLVPLHGEALRIPVDAHGADSLFDAFAGLPGLGTERMLHALNHGAKTQIIIWRRPDVHDRARALH